MSPVLRLLRPSLLTALRTAPRLPVTATVGFHQQGPQGKIWDLFKSKGSAEPAADAPTPLDQQLPNRPTTQDHPSGSEGTGDPDAAVLDYETMGETTNYNTLTLPNPPTPADIEEAVQEAFMTAASSSDQPPLATEDWRSIRIATPELKQRVLLMCMDKLQRDVPNAQLNNMATAQDVLDYFLGRSRDAPAYLAKANVVAKYYTEQEADLPSNLCFIPHVPETAEVAVEGQAEEVETAMASST